METVNDSIRTLLKESQGKTFITFHPSLSYFARDYGLIQYSLEEGGKEPSPAHMAMLAGMARKKASGRSTSKVNLIRNWPGLLPAKSGERLSGSGL